MRAPHGGDALAAALREQDIDCVFTLCGNHTLRAYQGLHDAGIELVDTRTEAGASFAADAYARSTRRPAVALVTGGPGFTNALTGLLTAHTAGSPLVLLSGQVATTALGTGAQQDLDQAPAAAPLCKWSKTVTAPGDIIPMVREAFAVAMAGTVGAVHLGLPSDVLDGVIDPAVLAATGEAGESAAAVLDPADVEAVATLLNDAKRPVLIAGSGAYLSGCESGLERLLEASDLPLFTVDLARGMVSDRTQGVMGYGDPSLNLAAQRIREADLVLLLGKTLDFRLRFGDPSVISADARIVDVHAVGAVVDSNRHRHLSIEADLGKFTVELADLARDQQDVRWGTPEWRARLSESRGLPGRPAEDGIRREVAPYHPLAVARELKKVLPDECGLVLDAGDFVQWCRCELPATGAGRWLRLGPMSSCGGGTPLALGFKKANPDLPVFLICGDGSFGYYLSEFEAAARQGLPFVAIVGNNSSWGLEHNLQHGLYGGEYVLASELSNIRYDRVIAALGGHGEHVDDLDELGAAIERAIASGLPSCIEIAVSREPSPLTQAVIARNGEV